MNGKAKGSAIERKVQADYRSRGWVVYKAGGSLGNADLVALKDGFIKLLQVKGTARGPFHSFGPAEREALLAEAVVAGADPVLVWWKPRSGAVEFGPDDWPGAA